MEEKEVVLASSSTDSGISCWDLNSGAEHLHYRSCSSPAHGLTCIASRFLASSQIRDSKSSTGSILYWSWNKPQVEIKSFPEEPIKPLAVHSMGTYIVGGGVSGDIYLWEVATGLLLKKWHAHYRAVTCLVFSTDDSLLISGSEDGSVRVWSLFRIFDDERRDEASHLYEYSFSDHSLRVTDVVIGYGGWNAIIVSASEDRTCKVWCLSSRKLLRNIVFPSIIDAVALDSGERVFYAGGRDGKIYIAALNVPSNRDSNYGPHIIGSFCEHSKAITCLKFSLDGVRLVSGSEDGIIRVWDTRTRSIIRVFKHAKGPVNNVYIVRRPLNFGFETRMNTQVSSVKRHGSLLPPPLQKYSNSINDNSDIEGCIVLKAVSDKRPNQRYMSLDTMSKQITQFQQQDSSVSKAIENKRLKLDQQKSMEAMQEYKKKFESLYEFCVDIALDGNDKKCASAINGDI